MEKEYAVYRGDTFLFIGTAEECAKRLGVKADTIRWNASPRGLRRFENSKDKSKALRVIKLD